ncbi:phosphatidylcholine/phosphatidylserine synthase [Maritimibacter sp. DP1N21-5]|uniref:CDP-alcohol phosphatidyltransferase family protein n=1 Tax=Maritimibacter sp. DP1N21-5 TaxID=2836867 RepID=UPI001C4407A6|nr:phosphatidylcholine/phosphatidylserine synthase [Maritimibacter sp. DP1N21-5]MBV7407439.1 phosphatidylcholine/phosphatidylserine synthase [Maritimibacter sp. DP1N21-5]
MANVSGKLPTEFPLIQLLPNMLTITAICAGLSAMREGYQGDFVTAVQLILAAAILDGLDGRIARLLGSDSRLGAELDSLADFLNFGVAPGLVLYFWVLQDLPSAAWLAVLAYAVCCVMRLARFNVTDKIPDSLDDTDPDRPCPQNAYFTGVPAPAGAMLVMLPMFLSFAFSDAPILPGIVICFYMIAVGLLMISRIPTWSFKKTTISRANVKPFLVVFGVVAAAVMIQPWSTLAFLCLAYVGMVIWGLVSRGRDARTKRI